MGQMALDISVINLCILCGINTLLYKVVGGKAVKTYLGCVCVCGVVRHAYVRDNRVHYVLCVWTTGYIIIHV